ncbi:MAG: hypothetical protein U5K69_15730 [Balneolaceae bacterium]|nr:hypothetical protein [Balneolaceae bacterium]
MTQNSSQAMEELKRLFWEGTDHWETLLEERAEISGQLALSDYTRTFLEDFKNR